MLRNVDDALWSGALDHDPQARAAILDTALVRGEGARVQDARGRWYLDARSAMWNGTLGYSNTQVIDAMHRQLLALPVGQVIRYEQPPRVSLEYARELVLALPGALSHVRFGSTGSQMTASAVLLSRFVRKVLDEPQRTKVIAFHRSYHGTGAIAGHLSGERQLHALQAPLGPDVHHARPWSMDALRTALDRHGPEHVTAVVVEPVMGTGVVPAPPGMLAELRGLCDRHGLHLIADEITTGFGRTGHLSATLAAGVEPDMLVLGKGITSGYFPLAALVVRSALFDQATSRPEYVFPDVSTADGHPVAMAAGLAVLDQLSDGAIYENVRAVGARLRARLAELQASDPSIADVRGAGLMIGVELRRDGQPLGAGEMRRVRLRAQEHRLLVTTTNNTVNLMPPLVLTDDEADEVADRLAATLADLWPALEAAR
jgi:adenosylmethionine-8-amino-7-oxononanoate aminotransferase